ncbi:MAG: sigma-70 family RNA polymerase sigma factor [Ruminiclostridium sp.]|nr:sigma-70 family RNA polymerase sigma factor [Ruminiclostridium sp.]
MTDEKIIKLYFDRSEDAITETDKKYGGACRSVAYNILGSREDTEECTNDTYMEVWEVIPPKRPAKLGAFVVSIARHIALNMYAAANRIKNGRGYRSVGFDEIAECLPSKENVESEAEDKAVLKAVESFLSTLPREKQIMFVRRYYYGSTYGEIAADLNTGEDRVRMSLRRTREKLRKFLEKEGIGI